MRQIRQITVTETEKLLVSLSLFFRLFLGQYGEIVTQYTDCPYCSSDDAVLTDLLLEIRSVLMPDGDFGGNGLQFSLGVWNPKTAEIAEKAYDIYQCLRYQMLCYKNTDGQTDVRWAVPLVHHSWHVSGFLEEEYMRLIRQQAVTYPKLAWECPVFLNFEKDRMELWLDSDEVSCVLDKASWYYQQLHKGCLYDIFKDICQSQSFDIADNWLQDKGMELVRLMDAYKKSCLA